MFNKFKKLAAVCAALTLTFVFAATPVSAATSEVTAKPGETVTVKLFNAKGEFGVEGEISYDNKGNNISFNYSKYNNSNYYNKDNDSYYNSKG